MASAICPKCDPCGLMKSSRAVRCRFPPLLMSSPRLSPPKRSPPPRGNADPDAVTADMLKSLERFMVGLCWINVSYIILSYFIHSYPNFWSSSKFYSEVPTSSETEHTLLLKVWINWTLYSILLPKKNSVYYASPEISNSWTHWRTPTSPKGLVP